MTINDIDMFSPKMETKVNPNVNRNQILNNLHKDLLKKNPKIILDSQRRCNDEIWSRLDDLSQNQSGGKKISIYKDRSLVIKGETEKMIIDDDDGNIKIVKYLLILSIGLFDNGAEKSKLYYKYPHQYPDVSFNTDYFEKCNHVEFTFKCYRDKCRIKENGYWCLTCFEEEPTIDEIIDNSVLLDSINYSLIKARDIIDIRVEEISIINDPAELENFRSLMKEIAEISDAKLKLEEELVLKKRQLEKLY